MTQEDDYKSPWKDKDSTTVNDTVNDTAYTSLNSWNDDISDSSKEVETSKYPIKDTQTSKEPITYTHIVDRVCKLSVGSTNTDPVVTGVGIIGLGGPRAIRRGSITQGMIHGGKIIISSNVIGHVLTNSSDMILKSDSFPFNPLKSQMLVIAPLTEPFLTSDRDVHASSEIGYSRPEHGRIGTPFVNKNIWSGDDNFSFRSDVGKANKLDTAVQKSLNDERNTWGGEASPKACFTGERA